MERKIRLQSGNLAVYEAEPRHANDRVDIASFGTQTAVKCQGVWYRRGMRQPWDSTAAAHFDSLPEFDP